MGAGSLHTLLQSHLANSTAEAAKIAQKQPYFILTPSYNGTVSLAYHRGTGEEASQKREIHFNAFTRATAHYDEPDCPLPKLPMIIEFTKDAGGKAGTGEFAFFSNRAPSIKRISACRTLKDLESAVPGLVTAFDEDNPDTGVWYNWFYLTDEGKLTVIVLKAINDDRGRLPSMDIWEGALSPEKNEAANWDSSL